MSETAKNSSETGVERARGRFAPGVSGNPRGRPPGSPNRASKEIKRAFMESLDVLDERCMAEHGVPYLAWVGMRHPKEFMRTLARLAPRELSVRGEHSGRITVEHLNELKRRAVEAGTEAGLIVDLPPAEVAVEVAEKDGGGR